MCYHLIYSWTVLIKSWPIFIIFSWDRMWWHAWDETRLWRRLLTRRLTDAASARHWGRHAWPRSWRNSRNSSKRKSAGRNTRWSAFQRLWGKLRRLYKHGIWEEWLQAMEHPLIMFVWVYFNGILFLQATAEKVERLKRQCQTSDIRQ